MTDVQLFNFCISTAQGNFCYPMPFIWLNLHHMRPWALRHVSHFRANCLDMKHLPYVSLLHARLNCGQKKLLETSKELCFGFEAQGDSGNCEKWKIVAISAQGSKYSSTVQTSLWIVVLRKKLIQDLNVNIIVAIDILDNLCCTVVFSVFGICRISWRSPESLEADQRLRRR